jgi:hypothetical protein
MSSPSTSRRSIFDESSLYSLFDELSIKPLHMDTLWNFLLKSRQSPLLHPILLTESFSACQEREARYWDLVAFHCPSLPQRLIERLKRDYSFLLTRVIEEETSSDGSTTKLLIVLLDGQQVESVVMRHSDKEVAHTEINKEQEEQQANACGLLYTPGSTVYSRITLCISSQVGCLKGCKFCKENRGKNRKSKLSLTFLFIYYSFRCHRMAWFYSSFT